MNHSIIVGGKIRRLVIDRPSDDQIIAQVHRANANGITIEGQGPFRNVAGVSVPVVVGPSSCTCVVARAGEWCFHRSLYAVATGQVVPLTPMPIPLQVHRQRRGWTRRSDLQPIPAMISRLRFDDGTPTPMDRFRARNRVLWSKGSR